VISAGKGLLNVRGRRLCDRRTEETYPLAEINEAYDRVAEGKVRFQAVVVNGDR
jgi:D-arabinose 1-dehydrogenase-like Zn-dependent alcohol dehydrogenase